ncbi:heavy metal translocating P-type ATPase [Marinospirillum alkaliphilum]|uniref:Cu2+-exporting ATPase n=1 Tax=Marinospirillum alkaliphilum DSM 21637 TaxID=1122209 RepID=A0A1K1VGS6_9GAMM|nr:heavy metal translocating P-type ATPase [Marinospirillum alkaliphilum]SFX23947.1 Cu2+-exporting ATPase [Marinospirillum alkaliphilum DSM 21637]
MTQQACFHCGEPVPTDSPYVVKIKDQMERLCCPGCEAVSNAIVLGGLESYYKFRTELPPRPELTEAELAELQVYDAPELLQEFVHQDEDGMAETTLAIDGITCAACAWLIEHQINHLDGVERTAVNLSAQRATLRWDIRKTSFSKLLAEFRSIGYTALPWQADEQQKKLHIENKKYLRRLIVAAIGSMQAMMFGIARDEGLLGEVGFVYTLLFQWAEFLLVTPVVLYSSWPFFISAWRELSHKRLNMDVPVSLAILLGYFGSTYAMLFQVGTLHFYEIAMFAFFLLFGRYIEMRTRHRIGSGGNALQDLMPQAAILLNERNEEHYLPSRNLKPGDRILIKPGHTFPVDGVILSGHSSVNEATMTGEYLPVSCHPGHKVLAGTQNIDSPLIVEVEKTGQDVRLASISRLSERALAEKPRIATLATLVSRYFVAATLLVSVTVFSIWWMIDPSRAFWVTLSVLVVTCPCALALATPTALAVANATLARMGVLITRGHVLEGLGKADHIIFDKTGTLTEGRLELKEVRWLADNDDARKTHIRALAAALEAHSEHPIARAFAESRDANLTASDIQAHTGQGISGKIADQSYRLGRADFACPNQPFTPPEEEGQWLLLADDQQALCWFRLSDQLRPDTKEMLAELQKLGITVELLSGDQQGSVESIAQELGISHYTASASPERKLERLRELQQAGRQVIMVGDGVNDVPVLAGAQVSIAMGDATDLAKTSADTLLMSSKLVRIPQAIEKARMTRINIMQNLAISLGYNLMALPAAAMGMIPPILASIGMTTSSLIVVFNALRLRDKASEQRLQEQKTEVARQHSPIEEPSS